MGGFVDWELAYKDIVNVYLENECDPEVLKTCSSKELFKMLDTMYTELQKEKGKEKAYEIQESVYDLLTRYESKGANSCTLMDGCVDTIDWLSQQDIPLGVCTSNSAKSADIALRMQGIRDKFQVIVGRSIGLPMKPDPAQLRKCFEQLHADPANSVMVGDSHKDIIAGKRLKAYTVGIPVYFTRVELMKKAGVDVIINSLSDLPSVI
jgi:HAD superfamily hydrolase (TIGR01509 family)